MATRLYRTGTTASITPAFDAGWEATANAEIKTLTAVQGAGGAINTPAVAGTGVANDDVAVMQLISAPIAAQTITGTLKGQFMVLESGAALDARAQVVVRVLSGDGLTVRGTLLAMDTAALLSEFNTPGNQNRKFPRGGAIALSSVTAQQGDVIVAEIGFRSHAASVLTVSLLRRNDSATTDLPEDETTVTATSNSWIEFSQTINFGAVVTPTTLALVLTTFAPTVSTPVLVTPTTKALTLTTFAPTVSVGANRIATPSTLALTLTRFSPTVTVAPTRAGFTFTDVTQGKQFLPRFSSISLVDERPCQLARLDCVIDDRDANITIVSEDEIKLQQVVTEGGAPVTIFAGDITSRVREDHGGGQGPRVYAFTAQDFTGRLNDNVITSARTVAESVSARVAWIMGWSNRGLTASHVAAISTVIAAYDYTGMSVAAALQQVAAFVAATMYVDYSKDLHFFTGIETNPAPFDLTRPASPPTSYPYRDFRLTDATPDLAHAVFVQGNGVSCWRVAAGAPTDNTRQERSVNDQSITTLADAQALGDSLLAKWSVPALTGRLEVYQPGLQGGMQVRVSHPTWGTDATYVISSVSMTLLGPALPHYAVSFSDHYLCTPGQAAFAVQATTAPVQAINQITQVLGDVSAAGANVVRNSSFESTGDWTVGSLWNGQYASASPYSGAYEAAAPVTGTDAGDLVTAAFIAVDRTQDWWLSFWSRVTAYTSGTARCQLREYNSGGTLLASTNLDLTSLQSAWTRSSAHFGPTATDTRTAFKATTTQVKIAFLTAGSARLTWELDAVQLERSAQLTSYAPAPYEVADGTVGTAKIIAGSIVTGSLAAGAVIALVTNTGSTVVIDSSGITITNGAINVKNGSGTVIIDGTSDMFRIATSGTLSGNSVTHNQDTQIATFAGLGTLSSPYILVSSSAVGTTAGSASAVTTNRGTAPINYLLDVYVAASSGGAVTTHLSNMPVTRVCCLTSLDGSSHQNVRVDFYNDWPATMYHYTKFYLLQEAAI